MSTAATAATVGIKLAATNTTGKAFAGVGKSLVGLNKAARAQPLSDLAKKLGYLSHSSKGLDASFNTFAWHSLGKIGSTAPRAALGTFKLATGLEALSAAAATAGIIGATEHFMTLGAEAGRTAARLNIPVEGLSRFQIAARLAGDSSEQATSGLQGLQATMHDAAYGRNVHAAGLFQSLGIDIGDSKRGVKDVMAVLPKIADYVQKLAKVDPNGAMRILDGMGAGRGLFETFKDGATGLAAYNAQAEQFGVITGENAKESRALERAQTELGLTFEGFGRTVGGTFAPAMTELMKAFQGFLLSHQGEINEFFASASAWLTQMSTPQNLHWLHDEFDYALDVLKQIGESPVFRMLFGGKSAETSDPADARHYYVPPPGTTNSPAMLGAPGYIDSPGMTFRQGLRWLGFSQHGIDENGRREGDPGYDPSSAPDAGKSDIPWSGPGSTPITSNARYLHDYFRSKGWSEAQADSILGHLRGESGANFDPHAFNSAGGGQGAQGIGQWRGDRIDRFRQMFHHDPKQGSIQEEAQYVDWELHNTESGTGDALSRVTDPADGAAMVTHRYGRPRDEDLATLQRDRRAFAQQYYQEFGGDNAPAPPYAGQTASDAPNGGGTLRVEFHGTLPPGVQMHVDGGSVDPRTIDIAQPVVRSSLPTPYASSPAPR